MAKIQNQIKLTPTFSGAVPFRLSYNFLIPVVLGFSLLVVVPFLALFLVVPRFFLGCFSSPIFLLFHVVLC